MSEQPLSRWPWRMPLAPLTMATIASDIAASHGLTLSDLRKPSRRRAISWARQEAYEAIHQEGFSHTQAVRFFGFKDHTSSVHACSAVAERRALNRTLRSPGNFPEKTAKRRADKHLAALERALAQQEVA